MKRLLLFVFFMLTACGAAPAAKHDWKLTLYVDSDLTPQKGCVSSTSGFRTVVYNATTDEFAVSGDSEVCSDKLEFKKEKPEGKFDLFLIWQNESGMFAYWDYKAKTQIVIIQHEKEIKNINGTDATFVGLMGGDQESIKQMLEMLIELFGKPIGSEA